MFSWCGSVNVRSGPYSLIVVTHEYEFHDAPVARSGLFQWLDTSNTMVGGFISS
jgi:hypothetical protein